MAHRPFAALVRTPARFIVVAFVALIALGTGLLLLPFSTDGARLGLEDAIFTSTSASTVTGLATVDIEDFSLFGELVILGLIQLGGFGIMTIGSVIALVAFRHVGLAQRKLAQAEIGAVDLGELSRLLWAIARITLVVEGGLAVVLFVRFWQSGVADGPAEAAYSGVFHAVSAFNNAGIALSSQSLSAFVDDPFVTVPLSIGFVLGGLGFPIMVEAWRRWRAGQLGGRLRRRGAPRRRAAWSLHAKLTLSATAALLVAGPVVVLFFEWTNPDTLGPLGIVDKLANGWFHGVSPRTAGFNTLDVGAMNEPTLLATSMLMFVGAGPASTSGGIKVTTMAVLASVLWADMRGHRDVNVFRRRLPEHLMREALTLTVLSLTVVVVTALALTGLDDLGLTPALFEATSAFGTVGLSTGVTGSIGPAGHLLLAVVMLCGRVGPITFVTALALRRSHDLYRYPEERPIIG